MQYVEPFSDYKQQACSHLNPLLLLLPLTHSFVLTGCGVIHYTGYGPSDLGSLSGSGLDWANTDRARKPTLVQSPGAPGKWGNDSCMHIMSRTPSCVQRVCLMHTENLIRNHVYKVWPMNTTVLTPISIQSMTHHIKSSSLTTVLVLFVASARPFRCADLPVSEPCGSFLSSIHADVVSSQNLGH